MKKDELLIALEGSSNIETLCSEYAERAISVLACL